MEDKLVTVAQFDNAFDAGLAKMRLESEGIEAVVVGADLVANMYTIDAIKVQLQVFEKDIERAEAVLASPPSVEDDSDDYGDGDHRDSYEGDEDLDEDFGDDEEGDLWQ